MHNVKDSDMIVRYSSGQRINHWIIAISFVLLALSGLAMFHPALAWLHALFGGGQWNRILHPFMGLFMVLFFAIFAARMFSHNRMEKRDFQWLRQAGDVISKREDKVPEVGRYNGGQKLLYFALIIFMLALLISGIIMWRPYFAFSIFPIPVVRVAVVAHAFFAFLIICAIIVHIYAGIWVKGSMRAMTRGTVSPGWAYKHHRLWWRQLRKPTTGK